MKPRSRRRADELLDKELQFHLDEQIADYVADGLPPEEARRRALIELGGVELAKEECRDARPVRWLTQLIGDIRYGLRMLAHSPGFTATSLAVLGLGIGAVTAIFTVINELAIQTPPFTEIDRLAVIREEVEDFASLRGRPPTSRVNFFRLRDNLRSFEDVTAYQFASYDLRGLEEPLGVSGAWAPANFAEVLGMRLLRGRWFTEEEFELDAPVAVLSEDLWRTHFGADDEVVGTTVHLVGSLENRAFTVIGVAPRITRVPRLQSVDVYTPKPNYLDRENRTPSWTVGRLAEGVSVEAAHAELAGIQVTLFPEDNYTNGGNLVIVRPLVSDSIHSIRDGLVVLFGAAVCVLLIACANVASLLLGRGAARRREMAVRAGLGAGAGRLFAQALTESLLLAGLGGVVGVFAAWAGVRGLMAIRYTMLPQIENVSPDLTVLAFAIGVSTVTALLFGALPAWNAVRSSSFDTLRQGGSAGGEGHSGRCLRQALVAGEVAVCLVLVACAGLLVHSVARLLNVDPGFDISNGLVVETRAPRDSSREQAALFNQQVEARLRTIPGVRDAAGVQYPPFMRVFISQRYRPDGRDYSSPEDIPFANARFLTSGFFRALGIPIIAGTTFHGRPSEGGPARLIVSRSVAEQHWPGENAVGRRVVMDFVNKNQEAEIVGVAEDTRFYELKEQPGPMLYLDDSGVGRARYWIIRTEGEPMALLPAVKEAIREIDPTQTFRTVSTLEADHARQTAEARFYMYLLSAFALCALLLSAVGLYGVVAFSATRRTQEIGVRMALGADRWKILRMFAAEGLWLAAIGTAAGLAGAVFAGRFLESWLYGVEPTDALTLTAACLFFALVVCVATYVPARRAARLDPLEALRYE